MAAKFNKADILMDKTTKELFYVVRVRGHETMLRNEKNDDVENFANHFVNRVFIKVDPDMVKTLYEDIKDNNVKD
jgi:hypothetical protein